MGTPHTELPDQHKKFLLDLFNTALEGGIGYWSECSEYHWSNDDDTEDINGFGAIIHPSEAEEVWGMFDGDKDTAPLTIDLEVMHRGARLFNWYVQGIVTEKGQQVPLDQITPFPEGHYHWQYVQAYASLGQMGDYDAFTADSIVQFGLFGEMVYG